MVQLSESRGRPALSILLATRNRASLLESTLAHFGGLELRGIDWELIVADNGSTDKTADVLERAGKRLPLLALHEPAPGKNRAINRALAAGRGELLIFTDDDVEPDAGWVQE
jgi:glycosyltransferase involved in cell wall biosynthesis